MDPRQGQEDSLTLPVRIEAKAWTDSRYATVALYLGLSAGDAEIALIRCAAIWRWQTEHYTEAAPTYVVPEGVVVGALKSLDGPRALVAAGLAELADGGLRIKGGKNDKGESRIDWYWRDQQQRSAAGKASEARRGSGGRFGAKAATSPAATDGPPTAHRRPTDDPPADDQRQTDSPDSGLRTPDPVKTHTPRARDRVVELAERLHQVHAVEARKLADSIPGCSDVSVGGGLLAGDTAELVRNVASRWLMEAAERDVEREPYVEAQMAKLVAVRAAKARSIGHVRWWVPSTFWDPTGIERDLAQTPKQAADGARPGHGARDSPRHQPAPPARRTPIRDL